MPGRSILVSISILWTFNPKQVAGGFRGPFCDPTEGVLKFLVGEYFCMGGDPLKKKGPLGYCRLSDSFPHDPQQCFCPSGCAPNPPKFTIKSS